MPTFAIMIIVLMFLWLSAIVGYFFRHRPLRWVTPLTTYVIWMLLFLMGIEVGSNRQLTASLGTLGMESAVAAVFMVAGSSVGALLFHRNRIRRRKDMAKGDIGTERPVSLWRQMKDSLVIVGFFLLGLVAGYSLPQPPLPHEAGYWTLCLLMACVGFSIGQNDEIRHNIRMLDKRLMLLPLVTILGTWAGMLMVCVLLPRISFSEWMAVGSGFGYYSLSGILITELKGAELGTIALISNVLREVITLLGAPLLARWFGPLAPISAGGCTTGDTTLPVITQVCGREMVPISIFHGLSIDFTVPFIISFFCSLS